MSTPINKSQVLVRAYDYIIQANRALLLVQQEVGKKTPDINKLDGLLGDFVDPALEAWELVSNFCKIQKTLSKKPVVKS